MNKEGNNSFLIEILGSLSDFKIVKNNKKIDLNKENSGWKESEVDYKKKQALWLKNIAHKKT